MVKNFITIAVRNFWKNKFFSLVNVIGLSVALTVFLIILQFSQFENSYDGFNENEDFLYRIDHTFLRDGQIDFQSAKTYPSVGPRLLTDYPEVRSYCRLFKKYRPGTIIFEDNRFQDENIFYADSSFLRMFSYPLIKGDKASVLKDVNTAIIEESMAYKLFGDSDPIGKRIKIGSMDGIEELEVTGIFRNPENSHLQLTIVCSYSSLISLLGEEAHTSWGWYDFYTYILFYPQTNVKKFESKLSAFVERYDGVSGTNGAGMSIGLRKVSDIHLDSRLMMESRVNGDRNTVYIIFGVGILILSIAWINYIILSTARAFERAKEVGLRKVVGSSRLQLSAQFIFESIILTFVSAILSAASIYIITPLLEQNGAYWISYELLMNFKFWIITLVVLLVGSLLAGLYPAFILSSFKPAAVLKGSFRSSKSGTRLRKVLIGVQFTSTAVLIIGILVVSKQINFLNSVNPGFTSDRVLILRAPDIITDFNQYTQSLETFKESVRQYTEVKSISIASDVPGSPIGWYNGVRRLNSEVNYPPAIVYTMTVDDDFLKTYDISMKAGNFYSEVSLSDRDAVILNESGIRALGFNSAEEALGNKIRMRGDTLRIVGVISDYHHESAKVQLKPTVFLRIPEEKLYYSIRYNSDNFSALLARVSGDYAKIFPSAVFDYSLLEDRYKKQYSGEASQLKMLKGMGIVAVVLCCMGLFALTSYEIVQRVKEIGVRKILGASDSQVFKLFIEGIINLVLISNVLAIPITIYLLNNWLDQFATKTTIGVEVFIVAGLMTASIAILAVLYNSWRATRINPIDAMKLD